MLLVIALEIHFAVAADFGPDSLRLPQLIFDQPLIILSNWTALIQQQQTVSSDSQAFTRIADWPLRRKLIFRILDPDPINVRRLYPPDDARHLAPVRTHMNGHGATRLFVGKDTHDALD